MYWIMLVYTEFMTMMKILFFCKLEMYMLRCLNSKTNKAVIILTLKLTSELASYNLLNKLHPFCL